MIIDVIIFRILGILAAVVGFACLAATSNPLALAGKGVNPAVTEIAALLAFIIAAICLVGSSILSALKQIAALLKSPPSP